MEVHRRRVIFAFEEEEIGDLARQLVEAVRRGWGVRQVPPPVLLLRLSDEANDAARATGVSGISAGYGAARNSPRLRVEASVPLSGQPVWLTPKEVADQAKVSAAYVRELCRERVLGTRDEIRKVWRIDSREAEAWMRSRTPGGHSQRTA